MQDISEGSAAATTRPRSGSAKSRPDLSHVIPPNSSFASTSTASTVTSNGNGMHAEETDHLPPKTTKRKAGKVLEKTKSN